MDNRETGSRAIVVTIGNELLSGAVIDTNSTTIARQVVRFADRRRDSTGLSPGG